MSAGRLAVAALCLAALAIAAVASWSGRIPDVEVRTQPWRTHAGAILPEFPVGQGFVCETDGLRRIDVAVGAAGGNAGALFELVLRERSPSADVLRRAEVSAEGVPPNGGFLCFEFEPVPDSSGKSYFFEIAPAPSTPEARLTPFVIYRGQAQDVYTWGDHAATPAELEGEFVCEHPDLHALAIGMIALDPSASPAVLVLWRADAAATEIARVEAAPRAPIQNGWAFFPMPVVHDSRWKTLRYRLLLPEGAQANAGPNGLSMVSYHGGGHVSPRLVGMTVRGEALDDRDLVFRAWTGDGLRRAWELMRDRAGGRAALALVAWIGASIAMLAMMRGRIGGGVR